MSREAVLQVQEDLGVFFDKRLTLEEKIVRDRDVRNLSASQITEEALAEIPSSLTNYWEDKDVEIIYDIIYEAIERALRATR